MFQLYLLVTERGKPVLMVDDGVDGIRFLQAQRNTPVDRTVEFVDRDATRTSWAGCIPNAGFRDTARETIPSVRGPSLGLSMMSRVNLPKFPVQYVVIIERDAAVPFRNQPPGKTAK